VDFENFCKNNESKINKEDATKLGAGYEELINKYKGYSKEELYAEFLRVASTQKAQGKLNKQELNNIYSTLSAYMNESEREKIKNLINKIG